MEGTFGDDRFDFVVSDIDATSIRGGEELYEELEPVWGPCYPYDDPIETESAVGATRIFDSENPDNEERNSDHSPLIALLTDNSPEI